MNFVLRMLNRVLGIINQLPEKQKIKKSPVFKTLPPKRKNKIVRTKVKPQKRKGPKHSEEIIYNQPRR